MQRGPASQGRRPRKGAAHAPRWPPPHRPAALLLAGLPLFGAPGGSREPGALGARPRPRPGRRERRRGRPPGSDRPAPEPGVPPGPGRLHGREGTQAPREAPGLRRGSRRVPRDAAAARRREPPALQGQPVAAAHLRRGAPRVRVQVVPRDRLPAPGDGRGLRDPRDAPHAGPRREPAHEPGHHPAGREALRPSAERRTMDGVVHRRVTPLGRRAARRCVCRVPGGRGFPDRPCHGPCAAGRARQGGRRRRRRRRRRRPQAVPTPSLRPATPMLAGDAREPPPHRRPIRRRGRSPVRRRPMPRRSRPTSGRWTPWPPRPRPARIPRPWLAASSSRRCRAT